jgi:hypothetical protein
MILVIAMMCKNLMQQIWSTIAKDIIAWLYLPLQKIRVQDPMVILSGFIRLPTEGYTQGGRF